MQRCCALQGYASGYAGLMDYEARCDVNYARSCEPACELRSGKARSVRPRVRRPALSAELSASRLLQTPVLGGYFPKLVNCPKKSSISRRPLLTVLAGVKSCKRGVSREYLRNFPVKSVKFASSKDFRFQDFKDFTKDFSNELRDFRLVADPSLKSLSYSEFC